MLGGCGPELRTSGPAKVLKLDITTTTEPLQNKSSVIEIYLRCRAGSRGSIVAIDDDRLLPGGEASRDQTRDKVIVSAPHCPYFDHTYSNADSLLHEPYVGGTDGGQFANVTVKTSG